MFGYVKPFTPELKVAQAERYRALYCGLCREMGRATGQSSRLTLSYDFTFFAAVRMILQGEEPVFRPVRCPVHPVKKRLAVESTPALRLSAAVSAALVNGKNADDLADERGISRLRARLARPFAASMSARAQKLLPEGTTQGVFTRLDALGALEKENCPSADETAACFGDLLGWLFSLGLEGEAAQTARALGDGIGRFVYLCDAADDLPEDVKKKRYNPLYAGWGDLALSDGALSDVLKSALSVSVPIGLEMAGEAAEKLDPSHPCTPIVKNIVYLGLPASLKHVLSGKRGKEPGKETLR